MSATVNPPRHRSSRHALARAGEAVLVVDDDPVFRSIVATRLGRAGVNVYQAVSVSEAIEAIASTSFDVVVSDYSMPHDKGTALLAYLTRRGFSGRFVLMSASLPSDAAAEAEDHGARAISKWDLLDLL